MNSFERALEYIEFYNALPKVMRNSPTVRRRYQKAIDIIRENHEKERKLTYEL